MEKFIQNKQRQGESSQGFLNPFHSPDIPTKTGADNYSYAPKSSEDMGILKHEEERDTGAVNRDDIECVENCEKNQKETYREHFYKKVEQEFSKIESNQISSIKDLENIPDGTYQLDEPLSINVIKELPYFNDTNGEIGLTLIENVWLLSISRSHEIDCPQSIYRYVSNGLAQLVAHSHPGIIGYNCGVPSFGDLAFKAIDGYHYIIFDKGVAEINVSSIDPEDITILEDREIFFNLIMSGMGLTKQEYDQLDNLTLHDKIYDYIGLERRVISYEQFYDLLKEKTNLKNTFWNEERPPFPGMSR